MSLLKKILCVIIAAISCIVYAEEFVVHKILVNGLQRVSLATVFSYLPVKEGDRIDPSQTVYIIRALYKTNFFSDVALKRSGNDLIISVVERQVIGSINVVGNKKITSKQITEVLKSVGLTEGQAIDHAMLQGIVQALIQQYYNFGFYNVKVTPTLKPQERNRVAVTINIKEGPASKIKSIKITGNKAFNESTLLREFSLSKTKLWSFFTSSDQYSKEKLEADLEKLRSYYMDRGYLHFKVAATKVTITPDKKHIYITVSVNEGVQYKISGFSLDGNLIGKRTEILQLIKVHQGEVFSRKGIVEIQANISQFLSDYGYGMPDIRVEPVIDDNNKRIFVKFIIDPGRRIYVRHINFIGNTKTHDEVLRRAMRQHEGALFSLAKVNESKRRLANLGYLKDIEYKTTPVPDDQNQVDLTFNVKEESSISAMVQGGYSDADGFIYGAGISDSNFFGTGKTVSLRLDNTKATQNYSVSYYNPYFTQNNIGFSFKGYLQKSNQSRMKERSAYSTDIFGALSTFYIPISDYTQISLGLGIEHIKLMTKSSTRKEVRDFVDRYGSVFNQFKVVGGWSYSNFDQAIFPTNGFMQGVTLHVYGPLNRQGLEFYVADHDTSWYQPLFKDFIFHTITDIGYGDGFGKTKDLPFFKNFYAGGIGSVRGFESGSLGVKDEYNHSIGGNINTTGSASIIIPSPWKDSVRPSVFVDIGNTYNKNFKPAYLRSSYGVQVEWRTPLGIPLILSYAKPIRKKDGDYLEAFQFSLAFSTQ